MDHLIEPLVDFNKILTEFGEKTVNDLRSNLAAEGLANSNLSKSIEYDIDTNQITITANPYWDYAEKGRGPGGVPRNFIDILLDWMQRYGIKPTYGTEVQFANAIKWKIIREGSSIYRGDRPERDFERTALDDNLNWLESQVADVVINRMGVLMP